MQLTHQDSKFYKHQLPVQIICDSLSNAANVGGIMRLADAFNVEKIWFFGLDTPLGRKVKKVSRSVEKDIIFELIDDILPNLENLKNSGYYVVAIEITSNSEPLNTLQLPKDKKFVVIVGNEINGVSNSLLSKADKVVHINMYGRNSSMNVVSSAAIALYEISRQIL